MADQKTYEKNRKKNRPKYANGNYKDQQKAYNKTKKGLELRVNANRLNRELNTYGNGDGKDAAHYKGSKTKGRLQSPSENRRSRLKIRK
jgi:hypothetical protein